MKKKIYILSLIMSAFGFSLTLGMTGCGEYKEQELGFYESTSGYTLPGYWPEYGSYYESGDTTWVSVEGLFLTYGRPDSNGEIVIPNEFDGKPVIGIGVGVFQRETVLKKGLFGSYYKEVDSGLKKITIPKSVLEINMNAFWKCKNLKTVIFEEYSELRRIDNNVFTDCKKLANIVLPNKLEQIGGGGFSGGAFNNCIGLKSIIIPKSVIKIDHSTFWGWTKKQTIYVEHQSIPEGWQEVSEDGKIRDVWIRGSAANVVWGYVHQD